jgi:hypothetical protein
MKRALICVGVAVSLVAATAASAAIRHYDGTVQGGGTVDLDAVVRHHHIKKVRNLKFNDIRVTCDSGSEQYSPGFDVDIPVVNKRFHFTGSSPSGGSVTVRGAFKNRGRRVTGIVIARGRLSAGTNCYGKHDWNAHRS